MKNQAQAYSRACRSIRRARSIALSGHVHPDGDSIGSLLALGLALKGLGKKVYMLCQDEIPSNYRALPGVDRIVRTTRGPVDLAIALDCSMIDLLGGNIPVFKRARAVLEIDHHEFRQAFGDMRIIDYKAAAVSEQVYVLLRKLHARISRPIAENLLTSIIVETNLFKLPNVRTDTFRICAELLKTGINFSRLADQVYGARTKESMMLSAVCLLRAKFLSGGRVIWSVLRKGDVTAVGGRDYDSDAIASEMNSMKGVEIAVLFREKDSKTLKVSLRSKGDINIGKLAQEYRGGGHFDIAGCYIPNTTKAIARLLSSVRSLLLRPERKSRKALS